MPTKRRKKNHQHITMKKGKHRNSPKTPPIPHDEHLDVLRTALRYWLATKKSNGQLSEVRTNAEVVEKLRTEGLERYNSQHGYSVLIRSEDFHTLRDLALQEIGVRILIGRDEENFTGSIDSKKKKLKKAYGLDEIHVPANDDGAGDSSIFSLYKETAQCLNRVIDAHPSHSRPLVAMGGGRTIFEAMWHVSPPHRPFTICALNYATRRSDTDLYDSSYLALAMNRLCRRSKAHVISLPPLPKNDPGAAATWHSMLYQMNEDIAEHFEQSIDPHIVFVGTGQFHQESPSISRFYANLGIDYKILSRYNPVGDINLSFFNAKGEDLTETILRDLDLGKVRSKVPYINLPHPFIPHPASHPFLLGLNIERLKQLVESKRKVILVAGGDRDKIEAIHTLLEHKIANGIITDPETLSRLVKRKLSPNK